MMTRKWRVFDGAPLLSDSTDLDDLVVELLSKPVADTDPPATKLCQARPIYKESCWWRMLHDSSNTADPATKRGKFFRRRFRVPFPIFQSMVEKARGSDSNNRCDMKAVRSNRTQSSFLVFFESSVEVCVLFYP
jgi:hypothetical protein